MAPRHDRSDSIRWVYFYAMSAIALVFLGIGAANLMQVVISRFLEAISVYFWHPSDPDWSRQRLSLAIPLLVLALPLWLFHWRWIERDLREGSKEARGNLVRGLFVAGGLVITFAVTTTNLMISSELAFRDWFGAAITRFDRENLVVSASLVMVLLAIWFYFMRIVMDDTRSGPATSPGAMLPQGYLHLALGVGLILTLFGLAQTIDIIIDAISGDHTGGRWWAGDLAGALSLTLAGGLAFVAHWRITERQLTHTVWWGRSNREAVLRFGALTVLATACAVMMLVGLSQAMKSSIQPGTGASQILSKVGFALPFAGGWQLVRWWLIGETPDRTGALEVVNRRRAHDYAMSLLGLAWGASGLVLLLTYLIGRVAGDSANMRDTIAWPISMVATGVGLWGWHWIGVALRLGRDPAGEQGSDVRRAYLLTVIGFSIVALLVGLVTASYQILQRVLAVSHGASLLHDLDWPLALLVTGLGAGVYHGLLLRRDLAIRPLTSREMQPARVLLILTGPPSGDIQVVVHLLQETLPDGYELEVETADALQPLLGEPTAGPVIGTTRTTAAT